MMWGSIYRMKPINGTAAAVARKRKKLRAPNVSPYAERRAARAIERASWVRENTRHAKR